MDSILLVRKAGSSWLKIASCDAAERVVDCFARRVRRKIAALAGTTNGEGVLGRVTDEEQMLAEHTLATIGVEAADCAPAPA